MSTAEIQWPNWFARLPCKESSRTQRRSVERDAAACIVPKKDISKILSKPADQVSHLCYTTEADEDELLLGQREPVEFRKLRGDRNKLLIHCVSV